MLDDLLETLIDITTEVGGNLLEGKLSQNGMLEKQLYKEKLKKAMERDKRDLELMEKYQQEEEFEQEECEQDEREALAKKRQKDEEHFYQEHVKTKASPQSLTKLQQAIVITEVLGQPVSRKRRQRAGRI